MGEALILIVVIGAVGLTAIARRTGIQAGLVIVVVAAGVSFIPGLARLELEPELILSLVMPPLLYSAALNFSFFSFMRNLRPIVGLGLVLVLVTAAAVTGIAAWLLPGIGVAGALVLAATVSPPDTVTTVTHGRELGLTKKVVAILTGESLVNDATALALFSFAVALAAGTTTFISNPVLLLGYGVVVGVIIGFVLGGITAVVRARVGSATLASTVNVLVPFAAYLIAEQLHASGVLAVVIAGFSVSVSTAYADARTASATAYKVRLQESDLWPVIDTLLEAFVFAYIGLQLRFVIEELVESGSGIGATVAVAFLVLLVVILVRIGFVFLLFGQVAIAVKFRNKAMEENAQLRAREAEIQRRREERARRQPGQPVPPPRQPPVQLDWKERLLVSWTGMRGIVTLAAAAAVPLTTVTGAPFPGRTSIQFIAFVVAIGTLVIQGATLPLLSKRLNIDTTEDEAALERSIDEVERIAADLGPTATPTEQRGAIARAVIERRIDDEFARIAIRRIDLKQASDEEPTD